MKLDFKDLEIKIPKEDPFKYDKLNRETNARILENIFSKFSNGVVISLNSEWGTGKTTFIKMFSQYLNNKGYTILNFNAWQTDFSDDPIYPLLAEFNERHPLSEKITNNLGRIFLAGGMELLKGFITKFTGIDAKAFKAALDEAQKIGSEALKDYLNCKGSLENFKEALKEYVNQNYFNNPNNPRPIIFFIDELDRCNPFYAVKVLERIKHCFCIPGIIFCLSIDEEQLKNSIKGYYNSDSINAEEYLRRFIDFEFNLPKPNFIAYCNYLTDKFELNHIFLMDGYRNIEPINEIICSAAYTQNLSLRQLEKLYGHIFIMCSSYPSRSSLLYLIFFTVIRKFFKNLYRQIEHKDLTILEFYKKISIIYPNDFNDDKCYFIGQIVGLYGRMLGEISNNNTINEEIVYQLTQNDDAYQQILSGINVIVKDNTLNRPDLRNILEQINLVSKINRS